MIKIVIAAVLFAATTIVVAQTYPTKPVTFIVPFPPGGGTDISARTVAAKLTQKWGQSVIAENRAGAAGILGADAAAKARPDGYTLLIVNVGITSIIRRSIRSCHTTRTRRSRPSRSSASCRSC